MQPVPLRVRLRAIVSGDFGRTVMLLDDHASTREAGPLFSRMARCFSCCNLQNGRDERDTEGMGHFCRFISKCTDSQRWNSGDLELDEIVTRTSGVNVVDLIGLLAN